MNITKPPEKTMLLHSCCAPCSSYVISYLSERFKITVFYYNPNIYPEEEYKKRRDEQKRFLSEYPSVHPIDFIEGDYAVDFFDGLDPSFENEPEQGRRCEFCIRKRMDMTEFFASANGFDYFATTLTVSPHKNAEMINAIGKRTEKPDGSSFFTADFKKNDGYKKSIELSNEYGLYRQKYCGCVFSRKRNMKGASQC